MRHSQRGETALENDDSKYGLYLVVDSTSMALLSYHDNLSIVKKKMEYIIARRPCLLAVLGTVESV
jgi:hypothetical protein